jgi:hypothetical protein
MKKFLYIYLLGMLLTSCSVTKYKYIEVQVLNPSDTMLPRNTAKLHILCQGKKYKTVFDTTLASCFKESPTFKSLPFVVQNEWEYLRDTARYSEGHVLLASSFHFVNYNHSKEYSYEFNLDNFSNSFLTSDVISYYYTLTIALKVNLYEIKSFKLYDTYVDTFSIHLVPLLYRVKLNTDLIQIEAAQRYARHIAAHWNSEERLIYCADKLLQPGYTCFNHSNLEGAIARWENVYEVGAKRTKAMAAYNIALAYEMLDNLDESEHWLLKSKEKKKYRTVKNYLNIIKERKLERIQLDKLLNN